MITTDELFRMACVSEGITRSECKERRDALNRKEQEQEEFEMMGTDYVEDKSE